MDGDRHYRGRFGRDQRGVSPVVGTILILVIMIISIGGIMAWGVPAIQGLQERAEYQAVLTQFLQMQSDVRGLRDPQNTRISQISVNDGRLSFDAGSRWVVTATKDAAYDDMYLDGWEADRPDTLQLLENGVAAAISTPPHSINVDQVTGGTFVPIWSCGDLPDICTNVVNLDGDDADAIGDVDFTAIDSVVRVQVLEGTGAKFEAWIFNVGHLEYHLTERNENNRLHFEMGAVFSQHDDFFYLEQSPTIKDPDYTLTPQDISLFVRVLQLTGEVPQGVGGRGQFPIVYHLVENYGEGRGRPSFASETGAGGARIQIHGELEVAFCNYFEQRFDAVAGIGWKFQPEPGSCPDDPDDWPTADVHLRFDENGEDLLFDLTHSVVTTAVRTS